MGGVHMQLCQIFWHMLHLDHNKLQNEWLPMERHQKHNITWDPKKRNQMVIRLPRTRLPFASMVAVIDMESKVCSLSAVAESDEVPTWWSIYPASIRPWFSLISLKFSNTRRWPWGEKMDLGFLSLPQLHGKVASRIERTKWICFMSSVVANQ